MLGTSFTYKGVHVVMNEIPEKLSFIGQNKHFTAMTSLSNYPIEHYCDSMSEFRNYMMNFIDNFYSKVEEFSR